VPIELKLSKVIVRADEERIARVVTNLVSNAIKFSPPGAKVAIETESDDCSVTVSVTDSGRGIPPEAVPFIFDRFSQVESADARVKGGSGLGLAIAKAIVELHGGSIWVESELGKGSSFKFSLSMRGY
jgi:signal transduction histidine kinase